MEGESAQMAHRHAVAYVKIRLDRAETRPNSRSTSLIVTHRGEQLRGGQGDYVKEDEALRKVWKQLQVTPPMSVFSDAPASHGNYFSRPERRPIEC